MRTLLTILVLLPLTAYCGKNDLKGSWREVKRFNTENETVSFKDTIFMDFLVGNEYTWQKAGGFIYRGSYKIENSHLDIGMRYFTIMEHKGNMLVLRDEAGTYEFKSYKKAAPATEVAEQEHFAPVKDISQMAGHWSTYKGTNSKTVQQIDYSRSIKVVDIFSEPKDGKWGYVYSRKDADNAPSWYIESYSNQTLYLNGKSAHQFKVIKCQDNDLIIEDDQNTFFMRQFK